MIRQAQTLMSGFPLAPKACSTSRSKPGNNARTGRAQWPTGLASSSGAAHSPPPERRMNDLARSLRIGRDACPRALRDRCGAAVRLVVGGAVLVSLRGPRVGPRFRIVRRTAACRCGRAVPMATCSAPVHPCRAKLPLRHWPSGIQSAQARAGAPPEIVWPRGARSPDCGGCDAIDVPKRMHQPRRFESGKSARRLNLRPPAWRPIPDQLDKGRTGMPGSVGSAFVPLGTARPAGILPINGSGARNRPVPWRCDCPRFAAGTCRRLFT